MSTQKNFSPKTVLSNSSGANARGCRPTASYWNCSSAERRQDYQRADAIKRANPAIWKHVNLYRAYGFLDIGDGVDLRELINLSGGSPR